MGSLFAQYSEFWLSESLPTTKRGSIYVSRMQIIKHLSKNIKDVQSNITKTYI